MAHSGASGGDAWALGGLGQALPATTTATTTNLLDDEQTNGDSKKDPKTFLGTHADLVNLDNLVSKPPGIEWRHVLIVCTSFGSEE